MTMLYRVLLAIVATGSVVAASTVGFIDPLADLMIMLSVTVLVIAYLRGVAKLPYLFAVPIMILTTLLSLLIYQSLSTTLYKFGLIMMGISILIMLGDILKFWQRRSRASTEPAN